MAQLNVAVLNREFQTYLTEEINREATLLNILPKRAERKATVEWSTNHGGKSVEGLAITADAPASSTDKIVPALLPVNSGSFQSAFTLNAKEVEEAAEQVSAPELRRLLRAHMQLAMDELLHTLSRACYLGDGSIGYAGVYGLTEAVNTKDYAGVSSTFLPLWNSQVIDKWDGAAVGTDKRQPLTTDDFLKMERLIRYRMGRYDTIITTPKVVEVYKKIFEQNRSYNVYVQDRGFVPAVDLGFTTASYSGKPIIDDAFCARRREAAESAITSALGTNLDEGVMYFVQLTDLELLTVPTAGSTGTSGVYTVMEKLAKQSLYVDKYVCGCIPQLVLRTRRNSGVIKNILVD